MNTGGRIYRSIPLSVSNISCNLEMMCHFSNSNKSEAWKERLKSTIIKLQKTVDSKLTLYYRKDHAGAYLVELVFRIFELRVLTVIDCPNFAGAKGL